MWSYLFLAGYVGRLNREDRGPSFEDLTRINRARDDDRRCGSVRAHATPSGSSQRPAHLRLVRYLGEEGR